MNTVFSHSGAIFEVTKNDTLIKHQLGIHESANKQLAFNANQIFKTPRIYNIGQHYFEMEYFADTMPLCEYFSCIDVNQVYAFIDKITNFIRYNITYYIEYDISVFTNKVNNVMLKLSKQQHLDAAILILKSLHKHTSLRVTGGNYHGDLTLSNVLVRPTTEIYLIDFLPGYIQSVELDYVKLIQESKLHWSALLAPDLVSDNYFTACEYLQKQLFQFYKPRTNLIEAINYLRILPYVKNDAIGTILCEEINNILQ